MIIKSLIISGIIAILLIIIFAPIVPYRPIAVSNDRLANLIVDRSLLTKEHLDRIEHVLKYYDKRYWRISNKKLLINISLVFSKELLWNFTIKAEDNKWLIEHPL